MGRRLTNARMAAGASIASANARLLALSKKGSGRNRKSPVSAAEVNKLLAARGHQISEAIHKEEQAIAKMIEDTAKQISKVHDNFHKH